LKEFFRTKTKKTKYAIVASLIVVAVFGVMQAMESKSATTDQVNLTVDVASVIDVTCPDPSAFGTLTPGTPVTTTATCTTTTNNSTGYILEVKRDDADTTLDLSTDAATNITDKTAWDSTANAGDGNAATWSGTGLGFRVMQTGTDSGYNATWWGSDDTLTNAKFAGLPSAYDTILDASSSGETDAAVGFRLDVPAAQTAGTYTGTATFQVTANP